LREIERKTNKHLTAAAEVEELVRRRKKKEEINA